MYKIDVITTNTKNNPKSNAMEPNRTSLTCSETNLAKVIDAIKIRNNTTLELVN